MGKSGGCRGTHPMKEELLDSYISQDSVLDSDFTLPNISFPKSSNGTIVVGINVKLKPRHIHQFEIPSKSKALLDFTLNNVASSGDSVIALIVVALPSHKKYNPKGYASYQLSFNSALKSFFAYAQSKSIRLEGNILIAEKCFDGLIFAADSFKASLLVVGCSTWKISMGKVAHYGATFASELHPSCNIIVHYNSKCIYASKGKRKTLSKIFQPSSMSSNTSFNDLNISPSTPPPTSSNIVLRSDEETSHIFKDGAIHRESEDKKEIKRYSLINSEEQRVVTNNEMDGERVFTLEELCISTSYFDENFKIGSGGCGEVYLGILPEGKEIVIKKISQQFVSESARSEAMKQMEREIKLIRRVHHKHLVNLLGISHTQDECLIVMDYFPNGSLSDRLLGEDVTKEVLTWKQRLKIALYVAEAIKYLHSFCDPIIIHRDIKSANILLDRNFSPKLSDFGLAKLTNASYEPSLASAIVGTNGYFAPDYVMSGIMDESVDVYSFGVVLFELLSAAPPFDQSRNPRYLAKWAQKLIFASQTLEIADPKLEGNFDKKQFDEVAKIACLCTSDDPSLRPKMTEVVHWLEKSHSDIQSL